MYKNLETGGEERLEKIHARRQVEVLQYFSRIKYLNTRLKNLWMLLICDLSYVPSHITLVSSYLHLYTHIPWRFNDTQTHMHPVSGWMGKTGGRLLGDISHRGCDRGGQTVTPRSEPTHMWAYSKWKELSQQPGAVQRHVCVCVCGSFLHFSDAIFYRFAH